MGENNKKPLTDEEVIGKMLAELKRLAIELEFGKIEFAGTAQVENKKVKQIEFYPKKKVKRFR